MLYSYYFKSESGDEVHIISPVHYKTGLDFMKAEFPEEYNAWKVEGCSDDEISYSTFDVVEYDDVSAFARWLRDNLFTLDSGEVVYTESTFDGSEESIKKAYEKVAD